MPVGRYFVIAGSLLVALLLIANVYLPRSSESHARPDVDKGIRITSPQKWPEKIVFDTRATVVSPAPDVGAAEADVAIGMTPGDVALPNVPEEETVAVASHLDAFAELKPSAAPPKARPRISSDSKRRRILQVRRATRVAANPIWRPLPAGW